MEKFCPILSEEEKTFIEDKRKEDEIIKFAQERGYEAFSREEHYEKQKNNGGIPTKRSQKLILKKKIW